MMFQKLDDGQIQNIYNVQFLNKTAEELEFDVRVKGIPEATIQRAGEGNVVLPAKSKVDGVYIIKIPESSLEKRSTSIVLEMISGEIVIDEMKTNFLGPAKR